MKQCFLPVELVSLSLLLCWNKCGMASPSCTFPRYWVVDSTTACGFQRSDYPSQTQLQLQLQQFYCENTLSFCETSKLNSPASLQVFHIK